MDMRELIKKDFGIDLPISGGFFNNSKDNPIVIDPSAGKWHRRVESLFLECICKGRGVSLEFLGCQRLKHNARTIDKIIIRTTEATAEEVVTQVEGFYFDVNECVKAGVEMTVADFPELWRELEARDTVFRMDFSQEMLNSGSKPGFGWAPCNGDGLFEEREAVWQRLFAGWISQKIALDSLTDLMERYYGELYPLNRALEGGTWR